MCFIKDVSSSHKELAIYVHWPFCRSICPYCHFNRYLAPSLDWQEWEQAFCREIESWALRLGPREVVSIFFGGGTPSLMKPALVQAIIQKICACWSTSQDLEITLEMNPDDIHALEGLQKAGVGRVSMGVQSFRQETLALLGRKHTLSHIRKALSCLQDSGIRYSFDLIYGHAHHQDIGLWREELQEALKWEGGHLSLYQLSYEEGTPFYRKRHEELVDEHLLQIEAETEETLGARGLNRYEVSNYAKTGHQSRHNLMYWHYQDYLGLGPGGCGRVLLPEGRVATETYRLPKEWLAQVREKGLGVSQEEFLTRQQQACEQLLMGLRLQEGIKMEALFAKGEAGSPAFYGRLEHCRQQGLIDQDHFALTPRGRCVLNSVVSYLSEVPLVSSLHERAT